MNLRRLTGLTFIGVALPLFAGTVLADDPGALSHANAIPECGAVRVIAEGFGPNFRNSARVQWDTGLPIVRLFGASMDQTFPAPSTSSTHTVTVTVRTPARIVYGPATFTIEPCTSPTSSTPPTTATETTDICVCPPTTEEPPSTSPPSPPTTPPTSAPSTSTMAPPTSSAATTVAPPSSTSSPSSSTTTSPSPPTPSSASPPPSQSFVSAPPECQPQTPPATNPPHCSTLPATGSNTGTFLAIAAALGALGAAFVLAGRRH